MSTRETTRVIAKRLGWWRWDDHGWDGRRVARALGLRTQYKSRGYDDAPRRFVNRATAEAILTAVGAE
jgi:hypothetical protein